MPTDTVKKYERRSEIVDVVKWSGNNLVDILEFINDETYVCYISKVARLEIDISGHLVSVNVGDYIVRHKDGTYEVATEDKLQEMYKPISPLWTDNLED